jgi:hypothetical protein
VTVKHGVGRASLAAGATQTTVATPGATLTTVTPANVTSKSLTAGTYLVWGQIDFGLTAATATLFQGGLSVVTATLPTQAGGAGVGPDPLSINAASFAAAATLVETQNVGPTILTIAVTTTLYLVAQATFSAGAITAYGTLSAVQI